MLPPLDVSTNPSKPAPSSCAPHCKQDSFSLDGLFLEPEAANEPITDCPEEAGSKGGLALADLRDAGADVSQLRCAWQNYDRERRVREGLHVRKHLQGAQQRMCSRGRAHCRTVPSQLCGLPCRLSQPPRLHAPCSPLPAAVDGNLVRAWRYQWDTFGKCTPSKTAAEYLQLGVVLDRRYPLVHPLYSPTQFVMLLMLRCDYGMPAPPAPCATPVSCPFFANRSPRTCPAGWTATSWRRH